MEAFDQSLGPRVFLRVEQLKRMAVAAQKALQAQHIVILGAAEDDRPSNAGPQHRDPAQDQRAHDALAELGLRDQQRAQQTTSYNS